MHSIGLDVSHLSTSVGVKASELQKIEKKFEKEAFLNAEEKKALERAVEDVFVSFQGITELNCELFSNVFPLTYLAKSLRWSICTAGKKMEAISAANPSIKGEKHEVARLLVLHSGDQERRKVFKQYFEVLGQVEASIKKLLALEDKLGRRSSNFEAKRHLRMMHNSVRGLMHSSVFRIVKNIERMYDTRIKVYKWVIRKSKDKDGSPAEKELKQLNDLKANYLNSYAKHGEKIKKMYRGEA